MKKLDYSMGFMRTLNTSYKYSCLITLTMNLAKSQKLYEFSKKIAKKNNVKPKKNYSVVLLRIGLLLNHSKLTLEDIFSYLLEKHQSCIEEKFEKMLTNEELDLVKQKCKHDIMIFKRVLTEARKDEQEAVKQLIGLYRQKSKNSCTLKHVQ